MSAMGHNWTHAPQRAAWLCHLTEAGTPHCILRATAAYLWLSCIIIAWLRMLLWLISLA